MSKPLIPTRTLRKLVCKSMQRPMDSLFRSIPPLHDACFTFAARAANTAIKGKDPTVHESRQRKNTGTIKTECPYRAVARKLEDGGYKLEVLEHNHNHGAVMALSALPQHRIGAMTLEERSKIKQMNSENHSANQILTSLRNANPNSMLVVPAVPAMPCLRRESCVEENNICEYLQFHLGVRHSPPSNSSKIAGLG
jgi:hypothetical protein